VLDLAMENNRHFPMNYIQTLKLHLTIAKRILWKFIE